MLERNILKIWVFLCVFFSFLNLQNVHAASLDLSKIDILASESINTKTEDGILKVYLNTFRPNTKIFFRVDLNNSAATTLDVSGTPLNLPKYASFQFSVLSGQSLDQKTLDEPIRSIKDASGSDVIEVYSAPNDFPKILYSGNTTLINKKQILSTPVVKDGTYAVASVGTKINYFIYSPLNLIGFRKISDTKLQPASGGTATYAYLEQKDFGVTATSPGMWRLLDQNFNPLEKINDVQTKYGKLPPEGHGMTTSPSGHAVVITTPTRQVDSSWLKRQYNLPVLDCSIVEVRNGKAIREFNWWDWAVAHKNISQPLLDAMPLFNDPQNPKNSPIDICHANSLEYYKPLNVYLISLRSPSILVMLTADLKNIKTILPANNSLQHFARFYSKNRITAFGNYTFGKYSTFLDFKLVNGTWKLEEYKFPIHIEYCANANLLDSKHVWVGGGCGPAEPGMLGGIYEINGRDLVEVGRVKMDPFIYSYRADLL